MTCVGRSAVIVGVMICVGGSVVDVGAIIWVGGCDVGKGLVICVGVGFDDVHEISTKHNNKQINRYILSILPSL